MAYEIILFDLDGTLTDPMVGVIKSIQYALSSFGRKEDLGDPTKFIGPPLQDTFGKYFGFSKSDTEKCMEKYREHYALSGLYENEIYPGIPELLRNLKNKGKQLAVATSKAEPFAYRVLEHFNIDKYFSYISGDATDGSRSRNGKGDIIRIALDNIDPQRKLTAVMIGDREHDIFGARDVGIDSIGITYGFGSRVELQTAGATYVLDSVEELCNI